jgi:hypothetical protein
MGSELVDAASGEVLWGLRNPRWYVDAWTTNRSLQPLHLSADERAGRYGRIRPIALLRAPAFAPLLRGIEPYTRLLRAIRRVTLHPDAVKEFPYDWRLPVAYNARRLAAAARLHLAAWRIHEAHRDTQRFADVRLVIVTHSMGGLLAQRMVGQSELSEDVRSVITLGTPFFGAVKAVAMIATGQGAPIPLPRRRLQALAVGLPAIYDLLPAFRCVDLGDDARHLTSADVEFLGGDPVLAERAIAQRPREYVPGADLFVQVVGARQRTMQSLSLDSTGLTTHEYTCSPAGDHGIERLDTMGDGTVHRQSAQLPGSRAVPLAQSHGAIAKTDEALTIVTDALVEARTGPWLGAQDLGLVTPDVVTAGKPLMVTVTGIDHPRDIQCRVVDVGTGRLVAVPPTLLIDGAITATTVLSEPGMYRIEVIGGGTSAVSEIALVGSLAA